MVTHLDVSAEDTARAGAVVRAALESPAAA
jgi:hypothetical protein